MSGGGGRVGGYYIETLSYSGMIWINNSYIRAKGMFSIATIRT